MGSVASKCSTGSPSTDKLSRLASSLPSKADGLQHALDIEIDEVFSRWQEGVVSIDSLGIYMEPLAAKLSIPEMNSRTTGGPLTHHFLIVDVDYIKMPDGEKIKPGFIRAEKLNREEIKKGIILVQCLGSFRPKEVEQKRLYSLKGYGEIPMAKLLETFESPGSQYSLLKDNCWKYADHTFRGVLDVYIDSAGPNDEQKVKLQKYLASLPPPRLPGDGFDLSRACLAICAAFGVCSGLGYFGFKVYSVATTPVLGVVVGDLRSVAGPGVGGLGSLFPLSTVTKAHSVKLATTLVKLGCVTHSDLLLMLAPLGLAEALKIVSATQPIIRTALGITGGVAVLALVAWQFYKFLSGLHSGVPDEIEFKEFVSNLFSDCWKCGFGEAKRIWQQCGDPQMWEDIWEAYVQ